MSSETKVELDFIGDLFTRPTKVVINKWYGGQGGAGELIIRIKPWGIKER